MQIHKIRVSKFKKIFTQWKIGVHVCSKDLSNHMFENLKFIISNITEMKNSLLDIVYISNLSLGYFEENNGRIVFKVAPIWTKPHRK